MQYARQQVIDSAELNSKLFSLVIPVILRESSGVSVLALRAGDHLNLPRHTDIRPFPEYPFPPPRRTVATAKSHSRTTNIAPG